MRTGSRRCVAALLFLAVVWPAGSARAGALQRLDDTVQAATEAAAQAAIHVVDGDREAALASLDVALTTTADAARQAAVRGATPARRAGRLRRVLARLERRLGRAHATVADAERTDARAVRALRAGVRTALRAERMMRTVAARGFTLFEDRPRATGFHAPGSVVVLRVLPGTHPDGGVCAEPRVIEVESASSDPSAVPVRPGTTDLGGGRFAVTLGPDLGGVRVRVTACGVTRTRLLVNLGAPGALAVAAPRSVSYTLPSWSLRAGVAVADLVPTVPGGAVDRFSVTPALPEGLVLDPESGVISGTPSGDRPLSTYLVFARNRRGSAQAALSFQVTPALPGGMVSLEDGFAAEVLHDGLQVPVKMALAPDGRLFFTELSGRIRVVAADGTLRAQEFAAVDVLTGGERGLLGIALAPDFATSGHLLVYASVPASGGRPDRNQVVRFTAVGDVGIDPTVILDDIPVGPISNGGVLAFGPDGKLYVTVGDTTQAALAQTDGELVGRVLRLEPDGSVPADNPFPGEPEWARGFRNCFGMTFHPGTGGLFVSENGPASGDEVNFVQKGKNFQWGGTVVGFGVGLKLIEWTPVIVPTGITFHSGTGFGAGYRDNLFVCGYDHADLRRLVMSGAAFTDVDDELPFALWEGESGVAHKPLDVLEAPDGALLVSTFSAIWRIFRY